MTASERRHVDRKGTTFARRIAIAMLIVSANPWHRATPGHSLERAIDSSSNEVQACTGAKVSWTLPVERSSTSCPSDMVEIDGEWCPAVEQFCLRPVDSRHVDQDRCAEFAATGRCVGNPSYEHFCIDRYEWPNRLGVKPVVAVDWDTARSQCTDSGKRLCLDQEWTLACEGQEHLPYPYGYVRNPEACNIDKPYIFPDEVKWTNPKLRPAEIVRLDQRDPSGARESCVSPYGVFDMTGNVDEWVFNEAGKEREKPYASGLKGGYWGPVRDRCRPMTTDHNEWHTGYQIGFRCCADVLVPPSLSTPRALSSPSSGPIHAGS